MGTPPSGLFPAPAALRIERNGGLQGSLFIQSDEGVEIGIGLGAGERLGSERVAGDFSGGELGHRLGQGQLIEIHDGPPVCGAP